MTTRLQVVKGFQATRPFVFQQPHRPVNWQELAGMDIERILQEADIQGFERISDSLVYGDMYEELRAAGLPRWAIKFSQMQQYYSQYLLYANQEMAAYIAELLKRKTFEEECRRAYAEIDRLRKALALETQKRQSDNMLLRLASVKPELLETLPRCLECGKAFGDYKFLVEHYRRRHPNAPITRPPLPNLAPPPAVCGCCCHSKPEQPPPPPKPATPRPPTPPPPPSKQESSIFEEYKGGEDVLFTSTHQPPPIPRSEPPAEPPLEIHLYDHVDGSMLASTHHSAEDKRRVMASVRTALGLN